MNPQIQTALSSGTNYQIVPQNQPEAFLYYMAKMDVRILSEILEDSRTYQNTTKELFMERLTEALEKFKEWGKDTVLEAIPGECRNEKCNIGCRGYAFEGNCSELHLDLIIEMNNLQIMDICHCLDFKTETKELNPDKSLSIEIYPDEKMDFQPTEEYLMTLHQCNNACDELLKKEKAILNLKTAGQWLEKYKELSNSFDIFYMPGRYKKFDRLYHRIKNLYELVEYKEEAEEALKFYDKTVKNRETENRIVHWLVKYERLGNEVLESFMTYYFKNEEQTAAGFFPLNKEYSLLIDIQDFETHLEFKKLYDRYYPEKLKKYYNLTEEERSKLLEEEDGWIKIDSLRYHLERNVL
jgi:hypothetical protein